MHTIIGLGNPGRKYTLTRHNIGFLALDYLAEKLNIPLCPGKGDYFFGQSRYHDRKLALIRPTTYMNNSGLVLEQLSNNLNDPLDNILIIYDDFHLPFGTVRLRGKGSDAGHNGIKSIIYHLQTDLFARMKIGIGSEFEDSIGFVLSTFNNKELEELPKILEHVSKGIISWCQQGIEVAMNNYNGNILNSSE